MHVSKDLMWRKKNKKNLETKQGPGNNNACMHWFESSVGAGKDLSCLPDRWMFGLHIQQQENIWHALLSGLLLLKMDAAESMDMERAQLSH